MSETVYPCDLCHLPVEVSGFTVSFPQGEKRFCCEGCKGIYLMLHGNSKDDQPDGSAKKTKANISRRTPK
ncbi:metal-binding protein [Candidatus Woesearchaeota archaeon]|nr:metal-binding protein [Candidatus Woesearchaeota archaeon]